MRKIIEASIPFNKNTVRKEKLNCMFLEDIQFKDKYIDISKPKNSHTMQKIVKNLVARLKINLRHRILSEKKRNMFNYE